MKTLTFKAGEGALKRIRDNGFDPASIGTIAGASGGAKWLVLSQLDRAILTQLVPQLASPVHLIGSSIGAWRFACYAQKNPLAAINRFEEAYVDQSFSQKPTREEITTTSRAILMSLIGDSGIDEILHNDRFRVHVMAVRSRRLTASENRFLLGAGLMASATANFVSRRALRFFYERALFFDERTPPPFIGVDDFPIQRIPLQASNLADSILASGSIPLVLNGIDNISGGRAGVYRDGGLIDYHHDLPHSSADQITLFPHFYNHLIPGWFDKSLPWRVPKPANIDRTVLVAPSAEFVDSLPNRKIPDRADFVSMSESERVKNWRTCIAQCEAMADEFSEALQAEAIPGLLTPLGSGR